MSDKSERGVGDGEEAAIAANVVPVATDTKNISSTATDEQKATKKWEPNPELMSLLTAMGISGVTAKKALFYTGNNSAEMAASWIFENPEADLDTPLEMEACDDTSKSNSLLGGLYKLAMGTVNRKSSSLSDVFKMVFIVNSSLQMGVGKIAAQVAHSAIGMHMLLMQDETKYGDSLMRWFEFGETKIVLRGNSTEHLVELEKKALEVGLPTYMVHDAGRTQIPSGSTTVLCIFGKVDLVDTVSGSLRLL